MEYIVDNLLYIEEIPEKLVSAISTMYSNVQLSKLNLTPEEIASISPNFEFELKQTEEKEIEGNPFVMMLLSLVLFFANIKNNRNTSNINKTKYNSYRQNFRNWNSRLNTNCNNDNISINM